MKFMVYFPAWNDLMSRGNLCTDLLLLENKKHVSCSGYSITFPSIHICWFHSRNSWENHSIRNGTFFQIKMFHTRVGLDRYEICNLNKVQYLCFINRSNSWPERFSPLIVGSLSSEQFQTFWDPLRWAWDNHLTETWSGLSSQSRLAQTGKSIHANVG